jgi:superfamily I DNA and/or RNA helicase/very-short-patch-repair endonuclease
MIDHWKQKLIDFSKKNSLLYFKFFGKSHLELTEFADELLDDLLDGKMIRLNNSISDSIIKTHLDGLSDKQANDLVGASGNPSPASFVLPSTLNELQLSSGDALESGSYEGNANLSHSTDESSEGLTNTNSNEELFPKSEIDQELSSPEEDKEFSVNKLSIDSVENLSDASQNNNFVSNAGFDPFYKRNKLLERLRSRDRIAKQDLGANILYLAYGFLEWKESDYNEKSNYSPLFLIPLYIDRTSGLAPKYNLVFGEEEEIAFNPALRMFLKQSFGISLDFIPEKLEEDKISLEDLDQYLAGFQELLTQSAYSSWQINKRKAISIFNFQKLVLFKEMENLGHKMLKHPFISRLSQRELLEQADFVGAAEAEAKQNISTKENTNNYFGAKDNFCVLDADSSQLDAIQAAKQNISFVLDGPPGTGKSQTITNIIAELLSQGKKILFVSEKKAALNVVRDRLSSCGLDNFCLVLHDTKKKDKVGFLKRLNECFEKLSVDLNTETGAEVISEAKKDIDTEAEIQVVKAENNQYTPHFRKLDERRKELNEYAKLLHTSFGELQIKPYQAYAAASRLKDYPELQFPIDNIFGFDDLKWDKTTRLIQKLAVQAEMYSSEQGHPWQGLSISQHLSLTQKEKLKTSFIQIASQFEVCRNKFNKLFSLLGYSIPKTIAEFENKEAFLRHLVNASKGIGDLLKQDNWQALLDKLSANKVVHQEYSALKDEVLKYSLEGCSTDFIDQRLQEISQYREMIHPPTPLKEEVQNSASLSHQSLQKIDFTNSIEYEKFNNLLRESFYLSSYTSQVGLYPSIPVQAEVSEILNQIESDLNKYKLLLNTKKQVDALGQEFIDLYNNLRNEEKQGVSRNPSPVSLVLPPNPLSSGSAELPLTTEQFQDVSRSEKNELDLSEKHENQPDQRIKETAQDQLNEIPVNSSEDCKWLTELFSFQFDLNKKMQDCLIHLSKMRELKSSLEQAVQAKQSLNESFEQLASICTFENWKDREILKFLQTLSSLQQPQPRFHEDLKGPQESTESNQQSSLDEWIDFCMLRDSFAGEELGDFFEKAVNKKVAAKKLQGAFEKRFYTLWIDQVELENPRLRAFRGEDHNDLVNSFKELDKKQFQVLNRERVFQNIQADFSQKKLPPAQLKSLRTMAGQKRPRKSIRRIIKDLRKLILEVHPCWMMSPLSVSQFIELESSDSPMIFDTVIFDEASQIFPEDAICSIFRAKQVIVAGDPEQMPPTSFGKLSNPGGDNADEDEDDENPEFESILNLSSVILKQRRPLRLLWHYRSKYEELIHASNQKIYNGDLITFPAANQLAQKPVKFVYVENGFFDRGKTKTNPNEAKGVAEQVIKLLRDQKDGLGERKSIGIIALGAAQTECIEEEINKLRIENPQLEEYFNENLPSDQRLFIKNLETVQGDERDIIILSIGYGKDASGKIYQNFGPINQKEVGHRRLNVAVTRAKEQMYVFCSFHHFDLKVTEEHSKGLNFLRDYLRYVESDLIDEQEKKQSDKDKMLIEQQIHTALRMRGYAVRSDIGCSEYKVGLGILRPNSVGSFVLGIECDGEMYNSAKTARDRDRLRQEVLENYGWHIHRVWSRDWWVNPERELQKIQKSIDKALTDISHISANMALV